MGKLNKRLLTAAFALFALSLNQNAAAVPVSAWGIDNPVGFNNGSWSFGEIFTVGNNNVTVTGLGAFDNNLDGFVTQGGIEVGIFRESDDALLVSTFVMSGDSLSGNYRFADIASLMLLANTQYRVVAVSQGDLYNVTMGTPDNVDSRISWDSYGYCNTSTLTSCDVSTGTERTWLASFLLDDGGNNSNVPTPGTLALLGLGLAGLGFSRKKKA